MEVYLGFAEGVDEDEEEDKKGSGWAGVVPSGILPQDRARARELLGESVELQREQQEELEEEIEPLNRWNMRLVLLALALSFGGLAALKATVVQPTLMAWLKPLEEGVWSKAPFDPQPKDDRLRTWAKLQRKEFLGRREVKAPNGVWRYTEVLVENGIRQWRLGQSLLFGKDAEGNKVQLWSGKGGKGTKLGEGGFGAVRLGWDLAPLNLNAEAKPTAVAVKICPKSNEVSVRRQGFASISETETQKEARIMKAVDASVREKERPQQPEVATEEEKKTEKEKKGLYIPKLHANDTRNGRWCAIELLGMSLDKLPSREFTRQHALDMLNGLKQLHEAGFVHRDVKLGNFILGSSDDPERVFTSDFGLAVPVDWLPSTSRSFFSDHWYSTVSQYFYLFALAMVGVPMGTRTTMSPNQWAGNGRITPMDDLWGLGATLGQMKSGNWKSENLLEELYNDENEVEGRGRNLGFLKLPKQEDPEQKEVVDALELEKKAIYSDWRWNELSSEEKQSIYEKAKAVIEESFPEPHDNDVATKTKKKIEKKIADNKKNVPRELSKDASDLNEFLATELETKRKNDAKLWGAEWKYYFLNTWHNWCFYFPSLLAFLGILAMVAQKVVECLHDAKLQHWQQNSESVQRLAEVDAEWAEMVRAAQEECAAGQNAGECVDANGWLVRNGVVVQAPEEEHVQEMV